MTNNSLDMEKQALNAGSLKKFLYGAIAPTTTGASLAALSGYKSEHPDKAETLFDVPGAMWDSLVNGTWSKKDSEALIGDSLLGGIAALGADTTAHLAGKKILQKANVSSYTQDKLLNKALPAGLTLTEIGLAPMEPAGRHSWLKLPGFMESVTNYFNQKASLLGKENIVAALGIGAGALALTGGGYALYKWLQDRKEDRASRTRMKMKISTPDGKDAIVDLPINNPELSSKLSDEFNRGVTRTVRRTARYNSMKLDPETNKYIPFPDWHKKYGNGQGITAYTGQATGETGEEYTQKTANLTNMPAYNMVDKYPEPAKESGYNLTRSDKVRRFLDALDVPQQQLDKMASMLEARQRGSLGEIFGTVVSPVITGTAAGLAANKLFNVPTDQSLLIGAGAAGLSNLLGAAAAGLAASRTQQEQDQHDIGGHSLLNTLMPGAAMFNAVQRAKVLPEQTPTPGEQPIGQLVVQHEQKPVVENKPLTQSDDFFDEEDDV